MIMNEQQLGMCLRMLSAYFGGEWDDARHLVWADAMQDMTFENASAAVREMGRTCDFAKVSTFLEVAQRLEKERIIASRPPHMVGTGPMTWQPNRELSGPRPDPTRVGEIFRDLRARLAERATESDG